MYSNSAIPLPFLSFVVYTLSFESKLLSNWKQMDQVCQISLIVSFRFYVYDFWLLFRSNCEMYWQNWITIECFLFRPPARKQSNEVELFFWPSPHRGTFEMSFHFISGHSKQLDASAKNSFISLSLFCLLIGVLELTIHCLINWSGSACLPWFVSLLILSFSRPMRLLSKQSLCDWKLFRKRPSNPRDNRFLPRKRQYFQFINHFKTTVLTTHAAHNWISTQHFI